MEKIKAFFSGVKKEVGKTHWPKGKELFKYSVSTLSMVVFFGLFFYVLDVVFAFLRDVIS
jgi:preprotein translocase subunit SecE